MAERDAPARPPATAHRRRELLSRTLLVIAALAYSGFPFELAAGVPLDPGSAYLSELAARDQPLRLLFAAADAVAAVAAGIAGVLMRRELRSSTRTVSAWVRSVPVALIVFGSATIVDVLSPMRCAPSADSACARAEASWQLGTAHAVHNFSSSVATMAAVALCVTVAVLLARTGKATGWLRAPATIVLVAALVASAVVAVASSLAVAGIPPMPGIGWWQRVQTLAFCLVFTMVVPVMRRSAPFGPERVGT